MAWNEKKIGLTYSMEKSGACLPLHGFRKLFVHKMRYECLHVVGQHICMKLVEKYMWLAPNMEMSFYLLVELFYPSVRNESKIIFTHPVFY